jgi:hypothetical protein
MEWHQLQVELVQSLAGQGKKDEEVEEYVGDSVV